MKFVLLRFTYAVEVGENIGEFLHHIQFTIGVDAENPSVFKKEMSPVAFIRNVVFSAYISIRFALFDLDVVDLRNGEMSYPGIIRVHAVHTNCAVKALDQVKITGRCVKAM